MKGEPRSRLTRKGGTSGERERKMEGCKGERRGGERERKVEQES